MEESFTDLRPCQTIEEREGYIVQHCEEKVCREAFVLESDYHRKARLHCARDLGEGRQPDYPMNVEVGGNT